MSFGTGLPTHYMVADIGWIKTQLLSRIFLETTWRKLSFLEKSLWPGTRLQTAGGSRGKQWTEEPARGLLQWTTGDLRTVGYSKLSQVSYNGAS